MLRKNAVWLLVYAVVLVGLFMLHVACASGQEPCPTCPARVEYYVTNSGERIPFVRDIDIEIPRETWNHPPRSVAATPLPPRQRIAYDRPEVRQRPFTSSTRAITARIAVTPNSARLDMSRTANTYTHASDVRRRGDTRT